VWRSAAFGGRSSCLVSLTEFPVSFTTSLVPQRPFETILRAFEGQTGFQCKQKLPFRTIPRATSRRVDRYALLQGVNPSLFSSAASLSRTN
jgi:hypothetical protein